MDFRELQYMLMVAEEKSFSKAAQKLYIAQPSLSQYIQKVEQQMGVQLFDRSSSPLNLTFAGELYVETAKRILDLKDQLSQQIEDIANLKKGRLSIGLSSFRSTYIMPLLLPLFHERFPGIEVVLYEGTSVELENSALNGTTDITITTLPIQENLLSYESIFTEEVLIALPPNYKISESLLESSPTQNKYPQISLAALSKEPFILLKQNQKLHQIATSLCRQAGFKPRIILESESIEAAHALVAAGIGVAFIPDTLAKFKKVSSHPQYFSLRGQAPSRTVIIAYRKGRYLSRPANEFINIAKEILTSSAY
jgi:DNA-binding transcriptional LysR family regulator